MNKQALLFKSGQVLFHTQDLAVLWGSENRHNLKITIYRYVKKGILIPVLKGLYSTSPIDKIDKYKLGKSLIHRYCYLSLASIFEKYGVINQKVHSINHVSSISKKIEFNNQLFVYKQMNPKFLLNSEGIIFNNGVYEASLERAVADSQYFNLNTYFDTPDLIDWKRVEEIKRKVGY